MFLLLMIATVNLYAEKIYKPKKVDPRIESSFKKQFGSATDVAWIYVNGFFVARFIQQEEKTEVYYYRDGNIFGIGKTVSKDKLPPEADKSLDREFSEFGVTEVYQFTKYDSSINYVIRLAGKRFTMLVLWDESGEMEVCQKKKNIPGPLLASH